MTQELVWKDFPQFLTDECDLRWIKDQLSPKFSLLHFTHPVNYYIASWNHLRTEHFITIDKVMITLPINQSINQSLHRSFWSIGRQHDSARGIPDSGPEPTSPTVSSCILILWRLLPDRGATYLSVAPPLSFSLLAPAEACRVKLLTVLQRV